MNIMSSFTNPHVILKLNDFLSSVELMKKIIWKKNQNILFCVPQKKYIHKGLERHEGEKITTE